MNIFSRIRDAVVASLNSLVVRKGLGQSGKPKPEPRPAHMVKFYPNNGRTFYGPVGAPDAAYHWINRQRCRAMLRAVKFAQISAVVLQSNQSHLWSRRERRAWARDAAAAEYLEMLEDRTNRIENEELLLAGAA